MSSWVASLAFHLEAAEIDDTNARARRAADSAVRGDISDRAHDASSINRALDLGDADIVARIRAGDHALYGQLFQAYWEPLCEVVAFAGHSHDDAREVVADVFATVWARRATWTVSTTVEAYLFGAARHRARRAYRDATHRRALLDGHAAALRHELETDDATTNVVDVHTTVDRLVRRLPERTQLALYLRWHRELEYGEIGEILGMSADAVRKLTTRALATLREQMGL